MIQRIHIFKRLSTLECDVCGDRIERVYYQDGHENVGCPECVFGLKE